MEGEKREGLGRRYCSPATGPVWMETNYSPAVLLAVGKVEESFQGSLASSIISEVPGWALPQASSSRTRGQGHLQYSGGHKPIKSKPTNS